MFIIYLYWFSEINEGMQYTLISTYVYIYYISWSLPLAVYKDINFLKALVFLELNLGKLQDSSMIMEES